MRGPLFSGAVGSAATLDRLAARVRGRGPVLVLSSLWLADALASELPVIALLEGETRAAARRSARKRTARSYLAALAGESLPILPAAVGIIVLEDLASLPRLDLIGFLLGLGTALGAEGRLIALDATKDRAAEARLAGGFLAAGFTAVAQDRPSPGALLTSGTVTPPAVHAAFVRSHRRRLQVGQNSPG